MRGRSSSLPPQNPAPPLSPGHQMHTSLGSYLDNSKSENDNTSSREDRGVLEEVGAQVVGTLKGAAYKLFKFHVHDWLALILLAVLDGLLNIISPYYRYVGKPMIQDFVFPLKPNTIPLWSVPIIAVLVPIVIFIIFFLYSKDITDLHHAILGILYSALVTAVLTDAIKNAVGRPRPDFFWRCFPDGVEAYNNVTFEVICHGDAAVIKEGHKSFPSGHTSWSFAGLSFLALYLAGKLQLFNRRGHVGKLIIVIIPLLGALLIGLSRVRDYWHHWNDVFGGAIIGIIVATISYHHLFPSMFSELGIGPHSYLRIGNNFTVWTPRWRRRSDWPPGSQDLDMELGRNSSI